MQKASNPLKSLTQSSLDRSGLRDGSIVQYDKNGPSGLTAAKIKQYAKDDRLNEALGLGPVTKTEALQRAAAGEPSVAVTERTPDGVPVKDAAGTTATAPEQIAALDAAKPPENTLEVRSPEAALAERQAGVAQEQVVQPQVVEPEAPKGFGKMMLTQADKRALRELGHSDEAISHMTPDQGAAIIGRGERGTVAEPNPVGKDHTDSIRPRQGA